jgi:hypothetical protein
MSTDTRLRTVSLSNAELITFAGPPDDEMIAKMEDVVESGEYYIDDRSGWVGAGRVCFLVVFLHSITMGIARAQLISDLSDRGIQAKIDPL